MVGKTKAQNSELDVEAEAKMSKKSINLNSHSGPMNLDSASAADLTVIAPTRGTTAILPAEYPLRRATFIQRKEHLLVQAPGFPEIMIPRFFAGGGQTTLATEDGVEISRHMVLLMSNLSSRVEKALSAMAVPGGE